MDHLVYIAASAARESMLSLSSNTSNLANASTSGFRADLVTAQSAHLNGQGFSSRAYAKLANTGVDFGEGERNMTGRDLDVAINGQGWIEVQGPDGSAGLSRRGDLRVGLLGQLLDGAGRQIMGNSGPIALPPYSELSIGSDGTLSIVPLGEDPNTLAVVDRIKLVNPDSTQLKKGPDGMIRAPGDVELVADANVTLVSGSLESSNVKSVVAMTQMIEYSRQFEGHVKMMETAQQLDAASAQLMKLS